MLWEPLPKDVVDASWQMEISEHSSSLREEDTSVQNAIPIPNPPLLVPSVVTPAPQDRWSQEKHIKLVNIIEEPKKAFEALIHPGSRLNAMQDELNQFAKTSLDISVLTYGKTIMDQDGLPDKRDKLEYILTRIRTESDEFIKSSVENLVPTPIEFEDFSDDECDLPPYDDSSKNHDFTFSNPLFDIDEDFTLSDESFSEEDIPKENFIIFSNPLLILMKKLLRLRIHAKSDISIDSSPKIDSLSNEFAVNSSFLNQFHQKLRKLNLTRKVIFCFWKVCSTITLLLDLRKLFKPILMLSNLSLHLISPLRIMILMEEIDLFLADDGSIPPGIESDDVDSVDDDTSISSPSSNRLI
ncbi:hypothetical protein Tco_0006025 [Tanacetum coccineum]